ncbi:IucA/IucC family protein [Streptomyces sp. SP18ES09]|uniref:IucA/IucC family protein n=1 Tax=Streptomyces sp. SP18ES09 TaxID=3002532 RepID=UPI002E78F237|nr:IucA/IucC family protein [Streptomyces sp. SP18ES09]MEE1813750.1 IucA/IucC family protein [Streptomyces sp. SP18ES09]
MHPAPDHDTSARPTPRAPDPATAHAPAHAGGTGRGPVPATARTSADAGGTGRGPGSAAGRSREGAGGTDRAADAGGTGCAPSSAVHAPAHAGGGTGSEEGFAAQLADAAPRLLAAYHRELPPARAAVLARLWRALLHEPLPGVAARDAAAGRVVLADGRVLTGPPRLPYDLVLPGEDPALRLDGRPYEHPAALLTALDLPGATPLVAELAHSVASLALSRAGAARTRPRSGGDPDDPRPGGDPDAPLTRPSAGGSPHAPHAPHARPRADAAPGDPLASVEQGIVDGHPYHPCCRSRPGLSVAEQLAYAPEHRPVVRLDLVAVPADRCRVAGEWPARLRDGDRLLLPVHPWQSAHVLPDLGHRPYVTGAIPALPLMSVRTLAPLDGGPHLKTALTTRMTSAVRDISPGGVENSAPLSALLGQAVADLADTFRITRNLAGASALVRGGPSADLAVLLRESPAAAAGLREGESVLPVAALAARPSDDGPPLIRTLLAHAGAPDAGPHWLAAFADLAVPPLLRLLARGVAPAAHGQNLLVVLDAHARPRRLVYRDLADVRLSPDRLARHGFDAAPVGGRVIDDDPEVLRTMLFGHLFGTTFGTLVSTLADRDRTVGDRLWGLVAAAAHRAYDALPATPENRADRAALLALELRVKALTLMRLRGADHDAWIPVPNPLAGTSPHRKCTS